MNITDEDIKNTIQLDLWKKDVFLFTHDTMGIDGAQPKPELINKQFTYKDNWGEERTAILFDKNGRCIWGDLTIYTKDMFMHQTSKEFKEHCMGKNFTWQQTIELEAYNRAINTFGKDSYDVRKRWITIRSGHGIGKTSFASVVTIHFLICYEYSQIGATANTDTQLKEIFLKEFYWWKKKLPDELGDNLIEMDDKIKIRGTKDWFLRARVAGKDRPEALAGLHGQYVFLFADEASGIWSKVFEVMRGALTGDNWLVIMTSNPTRTEGTFFDSHKDGASYTQLHFDSRDSPIVKDEYVQGIIDEYGIDSDEFKVRVAGDFPSSAQMDDKGWIPLFANVPIHFEPERGQIINHTILGVDPSGQGRDETIADVRDSVYLKEVFNEKTSKGKDLARKVESIMLAYNIHPSDVVIDGFGIGVETVMNIESKVGASPVGLLTDKSREHDGGKFASYKAELAWRFRLWAMAGGIIITNNQRAWLREMDKIKYKRTTAGKITLMPKEMFKKEYGFSPNKFDASCMTFHRDEPHVEVVFTKADVERSELQALMQKQQIANSTSQGGVDEHSSM